MAFILLMENSKKPEGPTWQLSPCPWPDRRNGLTLEGLTVVDFDNWTLLEEFREKYMDLCRRLTRTRRGGHVWFEGETQSRKLSKIDIKSGKGHYVVIPDTVVDGHEYRYESFGSPPPVSHVDEIFPIPVKEIIQRNVRDVRAYVSRIESIQGRNGSAGLIRAAAVCRDAGLTEAQATVLLLDWNNGPTVTPAWDPLEVARAISRVFAKGK